MKNKLLLTTAIASGMMISSAALAEVKVSGDVEATYRSVSYDVAAEQVNGGGGLGIETNIIIGYKGDLDNGLKVSAGSVIEDGTADSEYLTIGGEVISFTVGQDVGNNLSGTVVPHISDQDGTLYSQGSSTTANMFSRVALVANQQGGKPHEPLHVSLDAGVAGGTATFRYAPSMASTQSDSGIDDSGNSGMEILYAGSLGVEGLKVQVGTARQTQADDSVTTTDDRVMNKYGAAYNFGQVTVGAQRQSYDSGAATNPDTTQDTFAAVFAANDQIRIGARYTKVDQDGKTADEKMKTLEIGYNLGGLGIELAVGQMENVGGVAAQGDADVIQIRTRQAF
jgi:hypothetical protein